MNVTIKHDRAVVGWDITVTVAAEKGETIKKVTTSVNDFTVDDEEIQPPVNGWNVTLRQKGVYPEENRVLVTVTDGNDGQTTWASRWS